MNKNFLTLILVCVAGFSAMAQKTLSQGSVTMEITEVKSPDDQMAMALEMMKGSQTEIYFSEKGHATKMSMMGGMIEVKTYTDNSTKAFDMLMDMMGNKMWINSNMDEMAKDEKAKSTAENAKVTYDKNDTKVIAGYKCYAMTVTLPEAPEVSLKGYITQEIKTNANIIQGFQAVKFEGFPMEFTMNSDKMSLTMSTKEIKDTLDASMLVAKTDGYTKMTMEEFKAKMGGMGGGLGF